MIRNFITLVEDAQSPVTYTLRAGTKLYHRRWLGEEWDIRDMNFPAWFAFDAKGTNTASMHGDDRTEIVEFVVTRDVVLMDGEDDEIQEMYDEGASTIDIAEIPAERGYKGWYIPEVEVLLNDSSLVKAVRHIPEEMYHLL